ncbi:hypothetical protein glysoja_037013 [Glycine soja]|uniref:Telomere-associated protein Rif1 N-terminal domain-containing protein n=1 Tax=Glycine soja TaxID=3848 RepID=A0A0B2P7K4_GLYSO|nr:hypothetical protein glysoja_037013 [Glycine soja]
MLYHPSVVSVFGGLWCVSVQYLGASFLVIHFPSLLRAIVHALDNPMDSLSTTFEATQAIVKDMKIKLLNGMKGLLDNGMKTQAIRAWGWFARMLGSHALRNIHMLKIPERTFTDLDPQVQIATQVAWEGLIDALVHCPILVSSICHLLIYPIMAHSEVPRMTLSNDSASLDKYPVSPERKVKFELVIQTWKSLYGSLSALGFGCSSATNFSGDLCMLLSNCLDENGGMVESGTDFESTCNDVDHGVLHLSGNFLICILEQIQTLELVTELRRSKSDRDIKIFCCIKNCLKFVAKYMNFLRIKMVRDPLSGFVGTSRSKNDQLQLLWTEILSCSRSQLPINIGSALPKLHEPLFKKTLDHPYPSISEPTINFWNCTFGQQIILDFPSSLLCVLDKLSRNGRLKLQKRSLLCLQKCHSHEEANDALEGCRDSPKHNWTSKRVELVLDTLKEAPPPLSFKKRRLELTEHLKGVRRAQQGRERDTGGRGPGIRIYTSADFTQGRDDSQESQEEIRNPEAILQMLRKTL